jgi:NADH pyrophosphatase NudC (nudix superfamily)
MDELIDKVMSLFIEGDGDDEFTEGYNFAVEEYREKVKQILSTAEVTTVKHGRWILENHAGFNILFCPECGYGINCNEFGEYYKRNFKFCPKCSAKMMDGVQKNE